MAAASPEATTGTKPLNGVANGRVRASSTVARDLDAEGIRGGLVGLTEAMISLGGRLDQMTRRIEALTAQVDTLRRSQSVYLGDHVACTYLQNGWRIFVDTRSFDVGIHLLMGGAWETMHSRVFERMLFRGAGVLDVGANMGFYSVLAGPHVGPEGLVIAVEANPHLARLVHFSLAINGILRYGEVHNVAASNGPGVLDLVLDPYMPGGGNVRAHTTKVTHQAAGGLQAHRVPAVALDELLGARRKRINVVKIDIEGAEPAALNGMRQLLTEATPLRILLEYNGHAKHIADAFRALQPFFEEQGFEPLDVVNEAQLTPTTWDTLIGAGERRDIVVARKSDRGWIHVA
ncbi:MAG: FkbM family methyltransferase [Beijerinckiaceae bacterium]